MNIALDYQRTLAIIKPHAVQHHTRIRHRIASAGFEIQQELFSHLSFEQARLFLDCSWNYNSDPHYMPLLIAELTAGPSFFFCLARENAIQVWRELMGPFPCAEARKRAPTSLRGLFSDPNADPCLTYVSGSIDAATAERELKFFFPNILHQTPRANADEVLSYVRKSLLSPTCDAIYDMLSLKPRPIDPLGYTLDWFRRNRSSHPTVHPPIPAATMTAPSWNEWRERNGTIKSGSSNAGHSMHSNNANSRPRSPSPQDTDLMNDFLDYQN